MDRKKAKAAVDLLQEMIDTNEEFFKEDGLRATIMTGGTIYPGSVVVRVEMAELNPDGTAQTKEAAAYRLARSRFPWMPALGFTFEHKGKEYQPVGYNGRRKKYPVIVQRVEDGKRFKYPLGMFESIVKQYKAEFEKQTKKKVKAKAK